MEKIKVGVIGCGGICRGTYMKNMMHKFSVIEVVGCADLIDSRAQYIAEKYGIRVNFDGGGYKGQSEAVRLGIARALVKINAEDKPALRAAGFITRDPRVVERKKPGQPGARKKFQFSKR